MSIPIIGDLIESVKDLVSEVIVDKDKKIQVQAELTKLADEADRRLHEETLAQLEINKTEAGNRSVFVAGWRPFIGWVGGVGLAAQSIVIPLIAQITGHVYEVNTELLVLTLGSMLGMGAMRSYDKNKGTSNDVLKVPVVERIKTVVGLPENTPWQ